MNKRQKLVQQQFLNNEKAVIKRLDQVYKQSLKDITAKLEHLTFTIGKLQEEYDWMDDTDPKKAVIRSKIQSKIYQKQYQEQLQRQVAGIVDRMTAEQYATIAEYLDGCYTDGFIGTIFDLHGQGVPFAMPIDQEALVRAVQLDSKISKGLYTRLGEDVSLLKRKITAQVSRGISSGTSFKDVAVQLKNASNIGYNNAIRIARTEGHRIQTTATMDACHKAKEKGADVVKQWDSTLDSKTRDSHVAVDGEIRELDKAFSNGLMYPSDPAGSAAEVINCRCALLQRARWALDGEFTKMNNFTKQLETFDSPEQYGEFKKAFFSAENKDYMDFVTKMEQKYGTRDFARVLSGMTDREYERYSKLLAQNPMFNAAGGLTNSSKGGTMSSKKPPVIIGGVDVSVTKQTYDFHDGNTGVLKTADAFVYTTPDGVSFVFPETYDPAHQKMTPEQAISTWQSVPQSIRQQAQRTIEFVDYYNPQDAYWRQQYGSIFTQSYATGGDKITFYRWDYDHDIDYVIRTYCHEAAHFIDTNLATTQVRFSEEAVWGKAMVDDEVRSKQKSCTAYGTVAPSEDFAESVAEYVKDKNAFAKLFPNRAAILSRIIT